MCVGKPHIRAFISFIPSLRIQSKAECARSTYRAYISKRCDEWSVKKMLTQKRDEKTERERENNENKTQQKTTISRRRRRTEPDELFRCSKHSKRIDNRTINILAINIVAIKCHNILYAFDSTCVFSLFRAYFQPCYGPFKQCLAVQN